jgi:hypothetical protein
MNTGLLTDSGAERKFHILVLSLAMAVSISAPALAGLGTPFTPPPASGVESPYNSDRDAPVSHPAASVSSVVRCAPAGTSTSLVNGAGVPAPPTGPVTTYQGRAANSVVLVNGASIPTASAPDDESWCGGAYREDSGTNFGSR